MDLGDPYGPDFVCCRCDKIVAKHGIGKHPDVCKFNDEPTEVYSTLMPDESGRVPDLKVGKGRPRKFTWG